MSDREKAIKLLVAKFMKLVESLEPGERLSIKKLGARKTKAKARKSKAPARKVARTQRPRGAKPGTAGAKKTK